MESEIRTYQQRAFDRRDPLSAARVGGPAHGRGAARGGHRGGGAAPSTRPPARVVGSAVLPAAYVRERCSAPGRSAARARHSSRCGLRGPEGAEFLVRIAAQEDVYLRARERRATRWRSPTRRRWSPTRSRWPERAMPPSPSTSTPWSGRRAQRRTGSRTPITRISSAQPRRAGQLRPSRARGARAARVPYRRATGDRGVAREASCAVVSRAGGEVRAAVTKAAVQRRLSRLVELAEG